MQFTTAASEKFQRLVAPLRSSLDGVQAPAAVPRAVRVQPEFVEPGMYLVPARILDVHVKPPTRSMNRFDIEVEGMHNYFVDGVMVHNSPETTSGGRALKFYASVRLDVRRIETLKDGTEAVGNRTRIKVVKNKYLAEGTRVFDPLVWHHSPHRGHRGRAASGPCGVHRQERRAAGGRDGLMFDQGERSTSAIRLRDSTELWVTPEYKVLTEHGWRTAGELARGDRLARPRAYSAFGPQEPIPPDHARLLGYLIGDGYVGGKTPTHFINVSESLQQDAARIVGTLGCVAKPTDQLITMAFSHRPGEKNEVIELCRWAGIYGCLAPEKKLPAAFFAPDVSSEVISNVIFGIFETDGYVSREQTGGIRAGFSTTSEQLAYQLHWLLLHWGIGSSVQRRTRARSEAG